MKDDMEPPLIPEPEHVEPARVNNPDGKDLRVQASLWITMNPVRYRALCTRALDRSRGGEKVNVSMLAEWLRLDVAGAIDPADGFKLNNNHRAYIARQMVADYPELEPRFRFRKTRY